MRATFNPGSLCAELPDLDLAGHVGGGEPTAIFRERDAVNPVLGLPAAALPKVHTCLPSAIGREHRPFSLLDDQHVILLLGAIRLRIRGVDRNALQVGSFIRWAILLVRIRPAGRNRPLSGKMAIRLSLCQSRRDKARAVNTPSVRLGLEGWRTVLLQILRAAGRMGQRAGQVISGIGQHEAQRHGRGGVLRQ